MEHIPNDKNKKRMKSLLDLHNRWRTKFKQTGSVGFKKLLADIKKKSEIIIKDLEKIHYSTYSK